MIKKIQLWLSYGGEVLTYVATILDKWPKFPDELKKKDTPKNPASK